MIPKDYFQYSKNVTLDIPHISVSATLPFKNTNSSEQYDLDEIITEIIQLYKIEPKKIVFSNPYEGFVIRQMRLIDKIVKVLINDYNVSKHEFIYIVGALPVKTNIENYKKICEKENFYELKVILGNAMEKDVAIYLKNNNLGFNNNTNNKTKKFISMNGVPRMHRIIFSMLLIDRNLLDSGHYSFQLNDTGYKNTKINTSCCPTLYEKSSKILEDNIEKFPMFLTKKFDEKQWFKKGDTDIFNESRFNIVQETIFFSKEDVNSTDNFNYIESIFITEKTWRSMAFSIPFVLLTRPHALKHIREYGYKTFHPYIDESYDEIEDDEKRMLAVLNEVERLCNITDKEWSDIHDKLLPVLKHNFDKIYNAQSFTLESQE